MFQKCKQIHKCCIEKVESDPGLEGRVEMKERPPISHWGNSLPKGTEVEMIMLEIGEAGKGKAGKVRLAFDTVANKND